MNIWQRARHENATKGNLVSDEAIPVILLIMAIAYGIGVATGIWLMVVAT